MNVVEVAKPDDWHVHLRDGAVLKAVVPFTARWFRFAVVMPNLTPPIIDPADVIDYRDRIINAVPTEAGDSFFPLMTLYFRHFQSKELRAAAQETGVFGIKYYPHGSTTNSTAGAERLIEQMCVLEEMAQLELPLLVHAESTNPEIDIFDREEAFLETELAPVLESVPELTVTVEHVSTRFGVDFVRAHPGLGATVTPHHLVTDRNSLLANGLKPNLYCKPILNSAHDRESLVEAVTSDTDTQFFLGTDSAPHPRNRKQDAIGAAGIFNSPTALQVVAEVFHQQDALSNLELFISINGSRHYGESVSRGEKIRLERHSKDLDTTRNPNSVKTSEGDALDIYSPDSVDRWTIRDS